jgi:simple sugar transport system ATP-binding protein
VNKASETPLSNTGTEATDAVIEACDVEKSFGHVDVLRGTSIRVRRGEVLALVGDNAAGKSTLMKTLAGVHKPDSGQVKILNKPVTLNSVRDSQDLGVQVVYQDLALAPDLTIAESVFLGHEPLSTRWRGLKVIDRRRMSSEAAESLERIRVNLPGGVNAPIDSLSGGQRQAVAIARAVRWADSALLMDEPTAALGVRQTDDVTDVIRAAADSGLGVIVISHDMPHMLQTADRICVLRHGRVVADEPAHDLTITKIVEYMLGIREERNAD